MRYLFRYSTLIVVFIVLGSFWFLSQPMLMKATPHPPPPPPPPHDGKMGEVLSAPMAPSTTPIWVAPWYTIVFDVFKQLVAPIMSGIAGLGIVVKAIRDVFGWIFRRK